jgi:hypothetical protein
VTWVLVLVLVLDYHGTTVLQHHRTTALKHYYSTSTVLVLLVVVLRSELFGYTLSNFEIIL